MTSQGFIYGVAAAITVGIQCLGFSVAYALRTEVFYDVSSVDLDYVALHETKEYHVFV